jgi:hypothetical protein
MLMIADELAALFSNMARYSKGRDNEFWLEAYNGKPYVVERMGRPPVQVDHLLVVLSADSNPTSSRDLSRETPTACTRGFVSGGPPNPAIAR